MNKPVVVVSDNHDGVEPWGVFTTEAKAQAFIDIYDRAVAKAEQAHVVGVCHKGDLYIYRDVEVDPPTPATMVGENLYLRRYFDA